MNFQYKARDSSGRVLSEVGEAENRTALIKELNERGLKLIAVMPVQSSGASAGSSAVKKKTSVLRRQIGGRVKPQEIVFFSRDLYTLIHSGTSIVSGLKDITDQIRNQYFANILRQMLSGIESGSKLSEVMEKYPRVFSEVYTSSIRVGEHTGRLEYVLKRLIEIMEREIETEHAVKNALRYPMIVLCFILIAFVIIIIVVIPKLATVFASLHANLPLPTRIIIGIGQISQQYWSLVLGVLAVSFLFFQIWKATKSGKFRWDWMKLNMPVFGSLISKSALSKFAGSLQILHESGLVLPEALKLSSRVVGNEVITQAILKVHEDVTRGKQFSEVLKQHKVFPPLVTRMIMMGEKTGNLDEMLGEVMLYYDREIQYLTKTITTLIEPIVTVFLGVMVLVLALGVFLPMWNVYGLLTHH